LGLLRFFVAHEEQRRDGEQGGDRQQQTQMRARPTALMRGQLPLKLGDLRLDLPLQLVGMLRSSASFCGLSAAGSMLMSSCLTKLLDERGPRFLRSGRIARINKRYGIVYGRYRGICQPKSPPIPFWRKP
jgi:hypothetical protein